MAKKYTKYLINTNINSTLCSICATWYIDQKCSECNNTLSTKITGNFVTTLPCIFCKCIDIIANIKRNNIENNSLLCISTRDVNYENHELVD